jgi:hexokinase
VDGSLVEFYPGFEELMRETYVAVCDAEFWRADLQSRFREIPQVGEKGNKRIQIGIAKDGSGVGAALIAMTAATAEE